jgi:hypothetical protein
MMLIMIKNTRVSFTFFYSVQDFLGIDHRHQKSKFNVAPRLQIRNNK